MLTMSHHNFRLLNKLSELGIRFVKDNQGAVMIEFALVATVLISILAGLTEFSGYWMAYRRFGSVLEGIGEITASYKTFNNQVMRDIDESRDILAQPVRISDVSIGMTVYSLSIKKGNVGYQYFNRWNNYKYVVGGSNKAGILVRGNGSNETERKAISTLNYAFDHMYYDKKGGQYEGEDVIILAGLADYNPIFGFALSKKTIYRSFTITPLTSKRLFCGRGLVCYIAH